MSFENYLLDTQLTFNEMFKFCKIEKIEVKMTEVCEVSS